MNQELQIGDKIGFTILAADIDDTDKNVFFPIAEVTEKDGERAYIVEYPDGTRRQSAITQSALRAYAVQIEPRVSAKTICLSERKDEFFEALERGKDNRFEVYADWDKDSFVVQNKDNKAEYRVKLESSNGKLYGSCECPDFSYRKRLCKHQSSVLVDALFTVKI